MKRAVFLFLSALVLISIVLNVYFFLSRHEETKSSVQIEPKTKVYNAQKARTELKTKKKTSHSEQFLVDGCVLKDDECYCYAKDTEFRKYMRNSAYTDGGKLGFPTSVCESYIKHSGGSRYITFEYEPSDSKEASDTLRAAIAKKLEEYNKREKP